MVDYLSSRYDTASIMRFTDFAGASDIFVEQDQRVLRGALFKRNCLEPFRYYPPTVLLASYDLAQMRAILT